MNRNIFVAGASGAIGRRLCRLLVNDGWSVIGTTRSPEKAPMLRDLGVDGGRGVRDLERVEVPREDQLGQVGERVADDPELEPAEAEAEADRILTKRLS